MSDLSTAPLICIDITTAKQRARHKMSALRTALSGSQRLAAAQAVANHFCDHPYLTYAPSFAGYYPIRDELDVLPIFNRMTKYNKRMALPRIPESGELLAFKEWAPGQMLEQGAHGIKTPLATVPDIIPEVMLVPLLAFNSTGHRLGYGGGYYDRVIAHYRAQQHPTLFFGVGYSQQEDHLFPVEAHDQPLDGILTELGVRMFNRQTGV